MTRRRPLAATAAVLLLAVTPFVPAAPKVELFPLDAVRLLPSPFLDAQNIDHQHLLAHSPDRLLAPFRKEAGLDARAPYYPSWESTGLGGQTGGHYLSATSMMFAATGDAELKKRVDYMVAQLAECQKANGNGYVGGTPNSKQLWADVAAGKLKVTGFGLNDRWVPWYNLHKTFAGLRDAHLIAKNAQAKDVLIGLADWCVELLSHLSNAQVQDMLRAEHGGMPEVLADVYAITGDEKYLAAARRFCHRAILDPLVAQKDDLTGKHANTQIPKIIGFERISSLSGRDPDLHRAAAFFWQTVTDKRSVAIGGNSVGEHFNPPDNFSTLLADRTGPETCNTYNMLRLSEHLFRADPQPRYADFYERALYNHILSSQHPTRGGFVYFTPMRPRHYRVYSTAEQSMWCCVGTGIENHAKYGSFIYAHTPDTLYVNLFIPSELRWDAHNLTLRQETTFPSEPKTRLRVSVPKPTKLTLNLRHPRWLPQDELKVLINGTATPTHSTPASYASITREWRDGDTVDISLPMTPTAERPPDQSNHLAFVYGPLVLAAPTDEARDQLTDLFAPPGNNDQIADAPLLPLQDAPTLVTDRPESLASHLKPATDDPLTFTLDTDAIQPAKYRNLKLVPFHRIHETRYVLYFPTYSPSAYAAERQRIEQQERERAALDAVTLDRVIPGQQQSEVDHKFKGDRTSHGTHRDRPWRDASGGWFSYELTAPADSNPTELLVTYYGPDRGRTFDIHINDHKLATVTLTGSLPDDFHPTRYPLPAIVTQDPTKPLIIKFTAHPRSIAGGIFDLRLLRAAPQEP